MEFSTKQENNQRTLSAIEAQIVLNTTESGRPTKPTQQWLVEKIDIEAVVKAIHKNLSRVYIPTYGKSFKIKYHANNKVWISPEQGFTPCGWYSWL